MGIEDTLGRGQQIAQQAQQAVQTARDVAQRIGEVLGTEGPQLEVVRFAFRVLNGPDPAWHVRRVKYSEGLSQPYEIVVDVLTEDTATATDDLLGADVEFEIERGELLRTAYGVIHRVDYIGITGDKLLVRCYVVPAFRLASQRIDTRIFQDATVLEVVEQVLGPALEVYGRTYDPANNKISDPEVYAKRDYCVQYGESDFDFVSRLLEEEGIAYYFEPDTDAKKEKLVLIDNNNDYPEVTVLMDAPVPIIVDRPELHDRESLRYFEWCQPSQINKVVVWQHNWKVAGDQAWPVTPLDATSEAEGPPRGHVRELYIQGDRRKIVDKADDEAFAGEFDDDLEVAPHASKRLELLNRQAKRGQGRSNVTGFTAGYKFELLNHTRDDLEAKKYLITRVIHTGEAPEEERLETGGGDERYTNSFECIPDELPFRPALVTRRPRIYGPQTAIVTGPSNEEIHTDKFGRIKLKFHWDRLSPVDETSSAWVRVAQTWAGPGWGAMFIPRIGMEVVVEFLDGNPDRPLVTGCVYNAFTSTPFPLPQDKTKSTIKSQSSPNKQGYNEITFEDLAGSEQIIVHAQKDMNEKVENNHSLGVGVDQSYSIGNNQTFTVGGDQKFTVDGSQFITVKGQPQKGGFKGSSTDVTGHYKMTASDTAYMSAPNKITLECPGSSITLEPGKITIKAGGNAEIVLDANALMKSAAGSKVFLDGNALMKSSGNAQVFLDPNALVQASGQGQVFLDADALMSAAGGGQAKCTADFACSGAKATISSTAGGGAEFTANATVSGAEASLSGKGKAGVAAASVSIAGSGTCEISGGVVKIN
jgi:type VI secretion system secreted protein VgrG